MQFDFLHFIMYISSYFVVATLNKRNDMVIGDRVCCDCGRSPEWDSIPEKVKLDIGMQIKREGEFWSAVSRVIFAL